MHLSINLLISFLQLGRREILHLAELLSDDAFLARFHEKSGGNLSDTVAAILAHIDWHLYRPANTFSRRLNASISTRWINSMPAGAKENFLEKGLFYFLPGKDVAGRPLAVLNMDKYGISYL